MQFVPKDGMYVYFRYDNRQTVMVITNSGDKAVKPDWIPFEERMKGFTRVKNVVNGHIEHLSDLILEPNESFVFELLQ